MLLIAAILLAVFVVPGPWSVVLVLCAAVLEVGESLFIIVLSHRLARRLRPKTGAEAMIGMDAEVVSVCRPTGQVKVQGELWAAWCAEGASAGETVQIERLEGLTLIVARKGIAS